MKTTDDRVSSPLSEYKGETGDWMTISFLIREDIISLSSIQAKIVMAKSNKDEVRVWCD